MANYCGQMMERYNDNNVGTCILKVYGSLEMCMHELAIESMNHYNDEITIQIFNTNNHKVVLDDWLSVPIINYKPQHMESLFGCY